MSQTTNPSRTNKISSDNTTSLQSISNIFKRTEVIGRGKFGIVYKGYHIKTKHVYAIKVLNLDCPEDEVADVQKEIQFLSSLKKVPNITQYYGSHLIDTKLWIIMEYCAGGSLRTLLRPGKIDEKYIGVIMRELLVALVNIHKDNVIHRDIKAANVLITNDGKVKLCDFGIAAKLTQADIKRHTMAGTPYWMAPEVIMEGVYYDTKVDIWSLGITAYEIATGNPPYCEVEALRAMQLIAKSKPPRLEGRSYSLLLKEFIALCLDEDPKERQSADELLKSKFIKSHKNSSTIILKELITRYLLYRDKNKHRDSALINLEDDGSRKNNSDIDPVSESNNPPHGQVEVKWDFDSLSSNEYIIENDISIDAIPEDTDWGRLHSDVNYAYPDEDMYYQSNKPMHNYQNTTIGNTFGKPTANASTIQAYSQYQITNPTHYQSKNTLTTVTGATIKKSETKASKQLLQLFDNGNVSEEDREDKFSNLSKNLSTIHINDNDKQTQSQRQDPISHGGAGFHNQHTPVIPILQTNFKLSQKLVPINTTASASTPVEIEIPEELPVNTPTTEYNNTVITKSRSSTITSISQKVMPVLQRRPTISHTSSGRNEQLGSKPILDETQRSTGILNIKLSGKSPSPLRSVSTSFLSPDRGPISPLQPTASFDSPLSAIKAPGTTTDTLLHSLNNTSNTTIAGVSIPLEKESRTTRQFRRHNPNLKLQMPSPTTLVPNKLLDSTILHEDQLGNINQFGIDTSNSNLPVTMTPLGEKPMSTGDLVKKKQNTSNSSRGSSITRDTVIFTNGITVNTNNTPLLTVSNTVTPISLTNTTSNTSNFMQIPPKSLPIDMFIDIDSSVDGKSKIIDNKSNILSELSSLLKMFGESLPIVEQALKSISIDDSESEDQ